MTWQDSFALLCRRLAAIRGMRVTDVGEPGLILDSYAAPEDGSDVPTCVKALRWKEGWQPLGLSGDPVGPVSLSLDPDEVLAGLEQPALTGDERSLYDLTIFA